MRYRKKPVVIEAMKFEYSKESMSALSLFMRGDLIRTACENGIATATIKTLEGEITATEGDYIVRGVAGEHYPVKPDIFRATYELVGDDDENI